MDRGQISFSKQVKIVYQKAKAMEQHETLEKSEKKTCMSSRI